ncbi:MAG: hypothetical protein ACOX60_10390 [Massiliimalia sp.]|jgi:hypothetical protein
MKEHRTNAFSIIALVLGLVGAAVAAMYMVCRFLSDKAYHDKWKDYDDCGVG